jgi:hypothetical protein
MPQRPGGALEHAGVGQVKVVALGLEQPPGVACLGHAGVGQVHIGPAGEAVFKVPGGFAVADEDEFVHGKKRVGGVGKQRESPPF